MKKNIFLACLLFFSYFHLTAQTWPPAGMLGNGTSANPWQIADSSHLRILADYVNGGYGNYTSGKYYILMNDIDLGGYENWKPIGVDNFNMSTSFLGKFNGNGKVIRNLTINRPTEREVGLFGVLQSISSSGVPNISNLGLEDCNVVGMQMVGALVGWASVNSSISNCYASGNVSGNLLVGGLIGFNNTHYGSVSHCLSACHVVGDNKVGGLTGENSGYSTLTYCFSTGKVTGSGDFIGGLTGCNDVEMYNCVAANDTIISTSNTNYVNRVAGFDFANEHCYNNYALNSIVVLRNGTQMAITDGLNTTAGMGKAINLLQSLTFYTDVDNWHNSSAWDMIYPNAVWRICDNYTLPFLRWQNIICQGPFTITATAGNNGAVNPLGVMTIMNEMEQNFTFTANAGYLVDSLLIDGINMPDSMAVGSYTFKNVAANHTIHVTFNTEFFITATTGNNGVISPSGTINKIFNSRQTYLFTPAPGYLVDSLWIDGVYAPDSIIGRSYTFNNIADNHSIHVTFKEFHFCGGDGSGIHPYQICHPEQLCYLAEFVNAENGDLTHDVHYILMNDLDLFEYRNWKPIGDYSSNSNSTCFQGKFDGNGKTIRNLTVDRPIENYIGLFGRIVHSRIENLTLDSCRVVGDDNVGCLVGISYNSVISNCHATINVVGTGDYDNVGGLVGVNTNSSMITYCHTSGSVNQGNISGGLAGKNQYSSSITHCYSTANIFGFFSYGYTGGLVGANDYNSTISYCYATGYVNNNNGGAYVGGLVGWNRATVTNCFATGNVVATGNNTGGLIGFNTTDLTNCYATGDVKGSIAGGLVGSQNEHSISNCYATGNVMGATGTGGLVGRNFFGIIRNCLALNDTVCNSSIWYRTKTNRVVGENTSGTYYKNYAINSMVVENIDGIVSVTDGLNAESGAGKEIDTLKMLDFYTNVNNWNNGPWNIHTPTAIWDICDGSSIPFLRWQGLDCIFIPVVGIAHVADTGIVNIPLTLIGNVEPHYATNRTIIWTVNDAGATGANINENTLYFTNTGIVSITATIINGTAEDVNYSQEFSIRVVKNSQNAPIAPALANKTVSSITLHDMVDCEFRIDGGVWQIETFFDNLTANTSYCFEARKRETVTHYASQESPTACFTTDPVSIDEKKSGNVLVYSHQNAVYIKAIELGTFPQMVDVFDMTGRVIYQSTIQNGEASILISVPPGVYIIRLTMKDQKIILKKLPVF